LTVIVVPESGSDQLVGLSGKMTIKIADRDHYYDFEYTLPETLEIRSPAANRICDYLCLGKLIRMYHQPIL
jgi:hypothetical protein